MDKPNPPKLPMTEYLAIRHLDEAAESGRMSEDDASALREVLRHERKLRIECGQKDVEIKRLRQVLTERFDKEREAAPAGEPDPHQVRLAILEATLSGITEHMRGLLNEWSNLRKLVNGV